MLALLMALSIGSACPQDKPKMFVLTPCSTCRKEYRDCIEKVQGYEMYSKEVTQCEDTYVYCFRQHHCESSK